jgi:iron complex transport system substrate-binding protein
MIEIRGIRMKSAACRTILVALCALLAFMPANALDFTLQVFGNANMDGTIDESDIEYVQGIIDGSKDETELADANYDGAIDEEDIAQIELIIDGDEEFLVVLDDTGSSIRIPTPVTTFVYHGHNSYVYETLRAIGVSDEIVGITDRFVRPGGNRYSETYFPDLLSGVEDVGNLQAINYEVINNLRPDIVLTDAREYYDPTKTPDIPVVALDVNIVNSKEASMRYGYIFGKVSEAEEYVNWISDLEDGISERTETIPESERPLVYISSYNVDTTTFQVPAKDNYRAIMVTDAGGNYIGDEIEGESILNVDAEWVISRNPDVIIFSAGNSIMGYDIDDPQGVTDAIDEFMSRPEFANVNAVKNDQIHMVSHPYILCGGASGLIGSLYYAKWLYPDLFADMDVQAVHQEFITKFQHLDLDVKDSISVYPPPENE